MRALFLGMTPENYITVFCFFHCIRQRWHNQLRKDDNPPLNHRHATTQQFRNNTATTTTNNNHTPAHTTTHHHTQHTHHCFLTVAREHERNTTPFPFKVTRGLQRYACAIFLMRSVRQTRNMPRHMRSGPCCDALRLRCVGGVVAGWWWWVGGRRWWWSGGGVACDVCLCVRVVLCVCCGLVCTCVCICTRLRLCTCGCKSMCTGVCVWVDVYVCKCRCRCMCTFLSRCICMCKCFCICVYNCLFVFFASSIACILRWVKWSVRRQSMLSRFWRTSAQAVLLSQRRWQCWWMWNQFQARPPQCLSFGFQLSRRDDLTTQISPRKLHLSARSELITDIHQICRSFSKSVAPPQDGEDTLPRWSNWKEEEHQKLNSRKEECKFGRMDVRPFNRCDEKRKDWAKHWQCNTEVQELRDKPWRSEELRSLQEGLPMLRGSKVGEGGEFQGSHGGMRWMSPQSSARLHKGNWKLVCEVLQKNGTVWEMAAASLHDDVVPDSKERHERTLHRASAHFDLGCQRYRNGSKSTGLGGTPLTSEEEELSARHGILSSIWKDWLPRGWKRPRSNHARAWFGCSIRVR